MIIEDVLLTVIADDGRVTQVANDPDAVLQVSSWCALVFSIRTRPLSGTASALAINRVGACVLVGGE
jgi:hypothetical protein